MQNLFATGLNIQNDMQKHKVDQQEEEEEEFKTVQCIGTHKLGSPADLSKINLNDFNTMQNLFATNNLVGLQDVLGDKANRVE